MDIRISGHQVETGNALRDHATDRLTDMVQKYFSRAISAHVTFGKEAGASFRCDIIVHVGKGSIVKASGEAHDAHQAFDQAAAKVDKQLRRYKRRLTDRHEQADHAAEEEAAAYRIFAQDDIANDEESKEVADAPPIIAETRTDIPEASVADAVMMLDLRDTPALLFKNGASGRHNMVYRRADGSIGWVEPH